MPPLTWNVDSGAASMCVSVRGRPDPVSVTAFRGLLTDLCERPAGGLSVDMSAMRAVDRVQLLGSTLPAQRGAMASGTAVWLHREDQPDRTVVEDPPDRTAGADRPHRTADGHSLRARVSRDLDRTFRVVTRGPLPVRSSVEQLLPVSGAARRSRDVVTGACVAWDRPELTGRAAQIVSELVSYAIRRASTLMTVAVVLDHDVLYLWVRSGPWSPPAPRAGDPSLDLVVIDALACRWGSAPDGDDTLVWAALPAPLPG